jgi:hypothetical protein
MSETGFGMIAAELSSSNKQQGQRQLPLRVLLACAGRLMSLAIAVFAGSRFRAVFILATVVSLGLAPLPVASAHDRLAVEVAQAHENAAHGHSHEDEETHGRDAGHVLGHDSTDHSHQFAYVSASMTVIGFAMAGSWTAILSSPTGPGADFGIDRPPKQGSQA